MLRGTNPLSSGRWFPGCGSSARRQADLTCPLSCTRSDSVRGYASALPSLVTLGDWFALPRSQTRPRVGVVKSAALGPFAGYCVPCVDGRARPVGLGYRSVAVTKLAQQALLRRESRQPYVRGEPRPCHGAPHAIGRPLLSCRNSGIHDTNTELAGATD